METEKTCNFICHGSTLVRGVNTRDGKPTFNIIYSAGLVGGCKGPDLEQLQKMDKEVGKMVGSKRLAPPLRLAVVTGLPTARSWRKENPFLIRR